MLSYIFAEELMEFCVGLNKRLRTTGMFRPIFQKLTLFSMRPSIQNAWLVEGLNSAPRLFNCFEFAKGVSRMHSYWPYAYGKWQGKISYCTVKLR